MAATLKIHWRVPTTIAVAFLAGLLFAIGHHLFFASLAGSLLDENVFNQQHNLAIGSAFAFLVRAALVISIGATYYQVLWRTLLGSGLQLQTVDALAGLLESLINLASWQVWSTGPLLVFIAAIAWLIPFATIVPPATLTIRLVSHSNYDLMMLKVPDFLGTSMALNVLQEQYTGGDPPWGNETWFPGNKSWYAYKGPTYNLLQTVTAAALDGELPNFPSPAINASYQLSYSAPSVRCEQMPESILSKWAPVMGCDLISSYYPIHTSSGLVPCMIEGYLERGNWWPYLSWTPGEHELVPFSNGSLKKAENLPFTTGLDGDASPYLGFYNGTSAASLFLAAAKQVGAEDPIWFALNCSLYNSTYTTNFTFQEGIQTISVLDVNTTNPISVLLKTPTVSQNESVSQEAAINTEYAINTNYQAMMDSLGQLLVGDISYGFADDTTRSNVTVGTEYGTRILQTNLAFTKEMFPIYNVSAAYSMEAKASQWYQKPLAKAVEDLFQNITLSVFSRNGFLRDMDSPTNVTTTALRNIYEYNWQRLWLAYGLALGFAFIVLMIGSSSLAISGVSYSHKVSTILRVTGGDRVDVDIKETDRAGNDPLPEYLSKAELLCGV